MITIHTVLLILSLVLQTEASNKTSSVFLEKKGHYFSARNRSERHTKIYNLNLEECQKACLKETSFKCKIIDYNSPSKHCTIIALSMDEAKLIPYKPSSIYERTDLLPECCAAIKKGDNARLAFQKACVLNIGDQCKDVWAKSIYLKAIAGSMVAAVVAFI